jgi:hypothetical protein
MDAKSSEALCGHLEALLVGEIPFTEIQALVGILSKMQDVTYKEAADEISIVFTSALIGQFNIDPMATPHLSNTVQVDRKDGLTKSVYGGPFRILNAILELEPTSPKTQMIWAGMTNLKSVVLREDTRLSRQDKVKNYQSIVHSTEIDQQVVDGFVAFVKVYVPYLTEGMVIPDKEYQPVWSIASSDKKHMVYIGPNGQCESISRSNDKLFDMTNAIRVPSIQRLALEDPSEFLSRTLYGEAVEAEWDVDTFPVPFENETPTGKVGISPKNGMKPRVVVIMSPIMGSLSFPIGRVLKSINTQTTIQWVDDQDGAREDIQRIVSRNIKKANPDQIKSFDQSSFTDNFSYEKIQRPVLEVLKEIGIVTDYDIHIMDTVCTGLYDLSVLRKGYSARYGTGTPMGSYPSFPLASMCNGLLAAWAYTRVHGHFPTKTEHYAWIVGDDCVIRNSLVAEEYERICNDIGLKVNTSKSISSQRCVEFCSTFITPQGIFKKKKLPEFTDLGALVEAISYYGPEQFVAGFPRFRTITAEIEAVPKPFGLGPEVDLEQSPLSGNIYDKVRAKLQSGELSNLVDQVSDAREYMHGFNRSGIDAEARGFRKPLPEHHVQHVGEHEVDDSEPKLLRYEESLFEEVEEHMRVINNSPCDSEVTLESCVRIGNIYQYFAEKYPDALQREPVVFKIAPDKGAGPKASDLQALLSDLRSSSLPDSEDGLNPEGGDDYDF